MTLAPERLRIYINLMALLQERSSLLQRAMGAESEADSEYRAQAAQHGERLGQARIELVLVAGDNLIRAFTDLLDQKDPASYEERMPNVLELCRLEIHQGDEVTRSGRGTDYVGWLKQYAELAAVLAVFALPLFVVRALLAGDFNQETALAIVANTAIAEVGTSTLLLLAPALLQLAALLAGAYFGSQKRDLTWTTAWKLWGVVAITTVAAMAANSWPAAVVTVLATALVIGQGWWRLRGRTGVQLQIRYGPVMLSGVVVLAISLLAAPMWRPLEDITIDGDVRTVYMLSETADQFVVLPYRDRRVERVDKSRVSSRRYCEALPVPRPFGRSRLPHCADT